ncbi:MAG: PKD domain-containing protein [Flavobacteriales bacterium]|nr:PKD domain-containing protein [Flavobacteriales bacterium]
MSEAEFAFVNYSIFIRIFTNKLAPQPISMKTILNKTTMLRFLALATVISLFPIQKSTAGHLIGGELTYTCLGNDFYAIQLKVFRDCACTNCAFFDNPAYIFIYDDFGTMMNVLEVNFPGPVSLNYDPKINPCLELPPDLCVEEGVYRDTTFLPTYGGGYDIVHQRCCRNDSILNLTLASTFGNTFYARIPDTASAVCNSGPYFNNFPPIALCVNEAINFDHSATDNDGDSLVYSLCTPYDGASSSNPKPDPGTPALPPPYPLITFEPPYTFDAPLGGSPALSIDSATGMLSGVPTTLGQFVVAICVSEYRNGVLLSSNSRDFQFNVVECNAIATAALPSFLLNCDDTITFVNNSLGGTFYLWDFGDSLTDTAQSPVHVYQDTGLYNVSLIVNDGWPCTDTAYTTVNIYPDLISNFSYEVHCADSGMAFTSLATNVVGPVTSWDWSFGNGGSSTNQNPSYTYAQGGVYNVSLVVTNDTGCFEISEKEIYVYEEPNASIFFNSICADTLITFSDVTQLDSGSVISWSWDINSGAATGSSSTIDYTFDDPGSYLLALTVVTEHGCTGGASQTINVLDCTPLDAKELKGPVVSPFRANPNPSTGQFVIIKADNSWNENLRFEVYEVTGRMVKQMTGPQLFENKRTIDLKPYGSGIYFLKIIEGQETYTLRLVVN